MVTFFKILFLAKAVLLTPEPIVIDEKLLLTLDDSVSAITTGASLRIDVSNMFEEIGIQKRGYIESLEILNDYFPQDSVTTDLLSEEKDVVVNLDVISFALTNDGATIDLSSSVGVPVGVEFDSIRIVTKVRLNDVMITWKNFSK